MTKADLVARIAKDAEITQKSADMALGTFIKAIHEALGGPEAQIRIQDLGTFKVSKRKARTGVNPRTGEKIQIPEGLAPSFVAAKALKEAVKE
jgi:nucleoid DNA-binding protein